MYKRKQRVGNVKGSVKAVTFHQCYSNLPLLKISFLHFVAVRKLLNSDLSLELGRFTSHIWI